MSARVTDQKKPEKVVTGGYLAVREELKHGPVFVEGRDGRPVKARTYHMEDDELKEKLGEWRRTGRFPSPYTKSILTDLINALVDLGVNEPHALKDVLDAMKARMSLRTREGVSDWDRYVAKEKKTENGKSVKGRLLWAAMSLRRFMHGGSNWPTGEKMKQMGACIDIFRVNPGGFRTKEDFGSAKVFLRLNTYSVEPRKDCFEDEKEIPPVDRRGKTLGPK